MNIVCRHLVIRGLVQGVGYRWSLCAEAETLGLTGWVRNRRDGSVEALIHGPAEAVAALVGWAQRGPAAARVDTVISTEHDAAEEEPLSGFEQRTTL